MRRHMQNPRHRMINPAALAALAGFTALAVSLVLAALVGVSSATADAKCPNEAVREEQGSTNLPDCRAYEMVSPKEKNGGDIASDAFRTYSSLSGDAVAFPSTAAFGEPEGAGIASDYIARRTATPGTPGWATHSLSPRRGALSLEAALKVQDTKYWFFSDDLSSGILQSLAPLTPAPNVSQVSNLYRRTDALSAGPGSYELLSDCASPPDGPCASSLTNPDGFYWPRPADVTPDLGQVIFEANKKLTVDAPDESSPFCAFLSLACNPRLYEWDHGITRYVGFIPDSPDIECGEPPLNPCVTAPRSIAGAGASFQRYTFRTISDDGSRVFFTVAPGPFGFSEAQGDLYMRVDHQTTVQLNASERTDCANGEPCTGALEPDPSGTQPAGFQIASANGSRAFFVSSEQLTDAPGSGLYMYDTEKPASDPENLTLIGPSAAAAVAASEDGSYVYFYVTGNPLPGFPPFALSFGLYVWHEGDLGFVGSLREMDWTTGSVQLGPNALWGTQPYSARLSADGSSLLFMSTIGDGLTGYDQTSNCPAKPCMEVYLYRATDHSLLCLSCNPSGAPATASATYVSRLGVGGSRTAFHLNHAMSEDGKRVFFETGERLLPSEDRNGKTTDVYAYNVSTDTLDLITNGRSDADSHFLDASPDGSNVFFTTRARLSRWDEDEQLDLYDARVDGGFPEPTKALTCSGEACLGQAASDAAPVALAPSRIAGAGNQAVTRQRKHRKRHHKKRHHRRAGKHNTGNNTRGGNR